MPRIAIVIGVNKPRAPAPLRGAVTDAKKFADWIKSQGFEVQSFTDENGPVAFATIFAALERVVEAATYSQAVIYFAGHGLRNGGSEIWLLSGAPNNASEAISVEASVMAARESGLESVVFISDACRSIPSGQQNNCLVGGSIFPNEALNRRTRPEIDRLFATLPSLVAVEADKADDKARREGIFTREFMEGYRNPPQTLIDRVSENGCLIEVVTNRKLKDRVRGLVEDAAYAEMPKAGQLPEFILESVQAYVGRVERAAKGGDIKIDIPLPDLRTKLGNAIGADLKGFHSPGKAARRSKPVARLRPPAPSVAAIAQRAIDAAAEGQGVKAAAAAGQGLGISETIIRFSGEGPRDHFETETGFSVIGATVVGAISPLFLAEVGTQFVRLHPPAGGALSASVLIEFGGGSGAVLPGLAGYVGHIFVDGGTVTNVNYVPSANSARWHDYQSERTRVEALRATVAAAAGLGVFRISREEAASFADKIRVLKALDPTLGLYAAYAYASAGLEDDVRSVLEFMREDLHSELFDVAMLARRRVSAHEAGPNPIAPFCPMLRQGWSLLPVRDGQLADSVRQARDWLLPGLWTTFAPGGVLRLRQAIERGDFR
jgi:hypothetical protein